MRWMLVWLGLFLSGVATAEEVSVRVLEVYDGDTITISVPCWPELLGEAIPVRLRGIDAPELRGRCQKERALALEARDRLRQLLGQAQSVTLANVGRDKYFRLLADLLTDGASVAPVLISEGLAVPYDGGTKLQRPWCPSP
ncbi:MAG TPA: thermonuclease family protein [Alphaproteobacteria bacterium]|nr:thermonuclease family protein [Alphaproteobacteria bacterium]